jgi:hypothetical protein
MDLEQEWAGKNMNGARELTLERAKFPERGMKRARSKFYG